MVPWHVLLLNRVQVDYAHHQRRDRILEPPNSVPKVAVGDNEMGKRRIGEKPPVPKISHPLLVLEPLLSAAIWRFSSRGCGSQSVDFNGRIRKVHGKRRAGHHVLGLDALVVADNVLKAHLPAVQAHDELAVFRFSRPVALLVAVKQHGHPFLHVHRHQQEPGLTFVETRRYRELYEPLEALLQRIVVVPEPRVHRIKKLVVRQWRQRQKDV